MHTRAACLHACMHVQKGGGKVRDGAVVPFGLLLMLLDVQMVLCTGVVCPVFDRSGDG